ncbi:hypothetical protein BT96DRAFT_987221 [Gymnopus androsaceus JB14]|uniref:Uncharacterized protein n=1 Tax=Gymnopus androsaceus JB14 TaxID=1447944 RepID=A0A6A4I9Z1_9AGAR|nr:hypothetical protein BT96DRAFT_987221 [Gymnopus androsaceus JB14]
MAFSIVDIFTQTFVQAIVPSSSIVWAFVLTVGVAFVFCRICFPCTALRKLQLMRSAVEEQLKDYKRELTAPFYNGSSEVTGYLDYERRLLQIERDVINICLADYDAQKLPWKGYLSAKRIFIRLRVISSCYKEICALQREIEHSEVLSSKHRSDLLLLHVV